MNAKDRPQFRPKYRLMAAIEGTLTYGQSKMSVIQALAKYLGVSERTLRRYDKIPENSPHAMDTRNVAEFLDIPEYQLFADYSNKSKNVQI